MTPPNEPCNLDYVQNFTLNEKLIATAKEAGRRHDELADSFKNGFKPKNAEFEFESLDQAKKKEHQFCAISLRTNLVRHDGVNNYFKIHLDSAVKISLLIIDFIEKEFNARCKDYTSLTELESFRQILNENNSRTEKVLGEFKRLNSNQSSEECAVVWSALNEIDNTVSILMERLVSLTTICGLRKQIIPTIKKAELHRSISDHILYVRLRADSSVFYFVSYYFSKCFSAKILPRSPIERANCLVCVPFELMFDGWLTDCCKKIAAIIDPACQYSVSVEELELITQYEKIFSGQAPLDRYLLSRNLGLRINEKYIKDLILALTEFCKQMQTVFKNSVNLECDKLGSNLESDPVQMAQAEAPAKQYSTDEIKPVYSLRKQMGVWELIFENRRATVGDERGIQIVAYLLRKPPSEPIHAVPLEMKVWQRGLVDEIDLAGLPDNLGDGEFNEQTIEYTPRNQQASGAKLGQGEDFLLKKRLRELLGTIDVLTMPQSERDAAQAELDEIYKSLDGAAGRTIDSASKTADRVRKAIKRLHAKLSEANDETHNPNLVLRDFANHLDKYLIVPSSRFTKGKGSRNRAGVAGTFTYEPPPGVVWD